MEQLIEIMNQFKPIKLWTEDEFVFGKFDYSIFNECEKIQKILDTKFGKNKAFVSNYYERYEGPEDTIYLGFT
jgi:hypothetical protein